MCKSHQKICMCVCNVLVQIFYVEYTESTAGHMCVQSEIIYSAKSNAAGKYICSCCTCAECLCPIHREPHRTCVCNMSLFCLQSQIQRESICGNVALVPNYYVQYTDKTAGHICVQSEIKCFAKSNAAGNHICGCCTCARWHCPLHREPSREYVCAIWDWFVHTIRCKVIAYMLMLHFCHLNNLDTWWEPLGTHVVAHC